MSKAIPIYQQRLAARMQRNELRAERAKRNMQDKLQYLRANGKNLVADEAVVQLSANNPFLGKILDKLIGGPVSRFNQRAEEEQASNINAKKSGRTSLFGSFLTDRFVRLGSMVLPLLYTVGERRLLSYSLRGAGKLLRFGGRLLFRRRKKRK